MKIFVAGATGAIGMRLIPQLIERGHEVVGTTRSTDRARNLERSGAAAVVVDPLDRDQLMRAVRDAQPEVVIHQLTALSHLRDLKRLDDEMVLTNRLRTEALDHLLAAARAAGARRVIAQSYTGWPNIREGGPIKTEDEPLDPNPPAKMASTVAAIRYLEQTVSSASDLEGLVLRYGVLYGPGTAFGDDGGFPALIRQRRLPIIGDGAGVWSFIHVDDAAAATVVAVERGAPGIYNIVDDEPAPVSVWLPYLADLLGAKPPRRLPVWMGRLAVGEVGVSLMTRVRGSANDKAKRELGWQPRYPSWRDGFRRGRVDQQRQPEPPVPSAAA